MLYAVLVAQRAKRSTLAAYMHASTQNCYHNKCAVQRCNDQAYAAEIDGTDGVAWSVEKMPQSGGLESATGGWGDIQKGAAYCLYKNLYRSTTSCAAQSC
jgi:hypothetical protein